jgi:hypothetical protein
MTDKNNNFKTPILFLIFNRPKLTKQVFAEIKKIKPKQLYIAADGPRKNKLNDKEKCKETRKIINDISWNCEIKTFFREENLGCEKAVSSAITWFFKNVEQGIILEDDVLPDQSFFFFCQKLLSKYKNNKKVFNISGHLYENKIKNLKESYYFSKYFDCWGWATWADRWNIYFDPKMSNFPLFLKNRNKNIFNLRIIEKNWVNFFKKTYNNEIDGWSQIWIFNCLYNQGITCLPEVNLIKNVGFGGDATHTKNNPLNNAHLLKRNKINFPLIHPKKLKINKKADKQNNKNRFNINFKRRIVFFLKKINLLNFAIKIKGYLRIIKKL